MLYVVDASVALKWFFDEPLKVQARAFAQTLESGLHLGVAPDLLMAEVAYVVRKRQMERRISVEDARAIWRQFREAPIQYIPLSGMIDDAFALGLGEMVSFYDATYVSVAAAVGGRVLTADGGLVANFEPRGLAVDLAAFTG